MVLLCSCQEFIVGTLHRFVILLSLTSPFQQGYRSLEFIVFPMHYTGSLLWKRFHPPSSLSNVTCLQYLCKLSPVECHVGRLSELSFNKLYFWLHCLWNVFAYPAWPFIYMRMLWSASTLEVFYSEVSSYHHSDVRHVGLVFQHSEFD